MKKLSFIGLLLLIVQIGHAQTMEEYISSGDVAFFENKFDQACPFYENALKLDTTQTDYLTATRLAECYFNLAQYQKAIDIYVDSYRRGNEEKTTLAKIKQCGDNLKSETALLNAYLAIDSVAPIMKGAINERMFYIYVNQKKNQEAIQCAHVVLDSKPNTFVILKNVGYLYNTLQKTDSAIVYMEKALLVNPNDANLQKTLGLIYHQVCEDKMTAENNRYQRLATKGSSQYNTLLYNRQNIAKSYYAPALKHLEAANQTLNDTDLSKLIVRIREALKAYTK